MKVRKNNLSKEMYLLILIIVIISCQYKDKSDPMEENKYTVVQTQLDTIAADTMEENILPEDTIVTESEKTARRVQAYDKLYFGMKKNEVNSLNEARQKIGVYNYNFTYSYNGAGQLYGITIKSDPEKTVYYEKNLQPKYANICRVISEKYGKKSSCGTLPSIFDVMNAQRYKLVGWKEGEKMLNLYLRYATIDVYYVECRIVHASMEKAENIRLYRLKNKDILESSEKF